MRSKLCCYINSRRTVGTADDTDSTCLCLCKAEENSTCKCYKDTNLCGSTEDKALRVRDERTKVGHTTDAEEDKRRINAELNTLIEVIKKSAVCRILNISYSVNHRFGVSRHRNILCGTLSLCQKLCCRRSHNARIKINKQHTECDRKEQKRLILLFDCKVKQND